MAANYNRKISTAACLIIGDEVLGGKTIDTNSSFFAKYCFSLGISLKRIEVIADDEAEIIEAVRRMSSKYDFVVTSGGIGPTHDDITYQSIAKAFSLPLILHDESLQRMIRLHKQNPQHPFDWHVPSDALTARKRMVELPLDISRPISDQAVFTWDNLWVPLNIVNGNVHILPGVPRLFTALLEGYKPMLRPKLADPSGQGDYRIIVETPLPESVVAGYLTRLQKAVESKGVKVGSYPRWGSKRNTVTLVGKDRAFMDTLVADVEREVQGKRIDHDLPADSDTEMT